MEVTVQLQILPLLGLQVMADLAVVVVTIILPLVLVILPQLVLLKEILVVLELVLETVMAAEAEAVQVALVMQVDPQQQQGERAELLLL